MSPSVSPTTRPANSAVQAGRADRKQARRTRVARTRDGAASMRHFGTRPTVNEIRVPNAISGSCAYRCPAARMREIFRSTSLRCSRHCLYAATDILCDRTGWSVAGLRNAARGFAGRFRSTLLYGKRRCRMSPASPKVGSDSRARAESDLVYCARTRVRVPLQSLGAVKERIASVRLGGDLEQLGDERRLC